MSVNMSQFPKGLSKNNFSNQFQVCPEVRANPSLINNFNDYWNFYNDYYTPDNTNNSKSGGGFFTKAAGIQNFTIGPNLVSSQSMSNLINPEEIADAAASIGRAIFSKKPITAGLTDLFKSGLNTLADGVIDILSDEVKLRNTVNAELGLSGELSRGYRDNILDAYKGVVGMGYSFDELLSTSIEASKQTGRVFSLNEQTMVKMAETSRAYIGDITQMSTIFKDFELVGVGAEMALENINEAGKSSLSLGLNARKTTEEITKNIGKLNEYGFQNGIQGLNRMAQKSIEFRMSMEETFKIADKVMNPESALDMAANLQVLGGVIGSLGDPFQMMYMATNNVEGLQDSLIGAASSLATYNEEQGRFEITGVNLRRAKAMAEQLGVSYKDLAQGAIASAERSSAASELIMQGLVMDNKDQEFITNLAKMGPGGKMVIEVPSSIAEKLGVDRQTAIESLDQKTADALIKNRQEIEQMNTKDIALNQFTETQKMALNISEISAMLKVEFAKTYRGLGSEMDKYIKSANGMIEKYLTGEKGNSEISSQIDRIRNTTFENANRTLSSPQEISSNRVSSFITPNNNTNNQQPSTTSTVNLNHTITLRSNERVLDEISKVVVKNIGVNGEGWNSFSNVSYLPGR